MKYNLKQIREEVRKEVRKEYEERIKALIETCNHYKRLQVEASRNFKHAANEIHDLKEQIDGLNEKICQYEEWVERMQDFCNLPEEERLNVVRKYNTSRRTEAKLSRIFDSYLNLFNL